MVNWGFDLDEILCDSVSTILQHTNKYFGTSLTKDDMKEYETHLNLNVPKEAMTPVYEMLITPENYASRPLILDGLATLKAIKNAGCRVDIITSRRESAKPYTEAWLKQHEILYDNLYMTSHGDKSLKVQELGIQYFVEDNPVHAQNIAEKNIQVFIPIFPWNIGKVNHPCARYIKASSEILELIDDRGILRV